MSGNWWPRPIYSFGSGPRGARLWEGWRAYHGHEPIGPVRIFHWEAIADLPEAVVRLSRIPGHIETLEPYVVGRILDLPPGVLAMKTGARRELEELPR